MSDSGPIENVRGTMGETVCVIRGENGEVVASSSVKTEPVALIGSRVFWVYSEEIGESAPEGARMSLLAATYDALASEFVAGGPVGVFAAFADPEFLAANPEAVWPESGFLYAGYLPDDRQARLRYFPEGRI